MSEAVAFSVDSIQPFLSQSEGFFKVDLYLKGVKCGHCIHKITQEIEFDPGLARFQFEAGGKRLSLWVSDAQSVPKIIEKISTLGFAAIPLDASDMGQQKNQEFKRDLKRLAVAGVCAGNIMLFSTAIYLGADSEFRLFFHKLSLFLVVPVLFYSASSIWFGFFQSLKNLKFNLDLPIGLALLVGSLLSIASFLSGGESIYFDSIAVVVFLVLTSRFVLNRYVQSIYLKNVVHFIPGVFQARRVQQGIEQMVALQSLQKGHRIRVHKGEVLPVDGVLLSERAFIDASVLTGEFSPVELKKGDKLFAGTTLCMGSIDIETLKTAAETRVGKYIADVQKNLRMDQEESYQWVSYFTFFVLMASIVSFISIWALIGFSEAYQRAFAIILVACPCAVSFGIPLIRSFSGQLAIRNGLVLKQPKVLKKVFEIKNIFLDKTGTLTLGSIGVESADFQKLEKQDQRKLLSLELEMNHPISNGFKAFVTEDFEPLKVSHFNYLPAKGISGKIEGELWEVISAPNCEKGGKRLQVIKDGQFLSYISLKSALKDNLREFFEELSELGKRVSIVSGDRMEQVEEIRQCVPDHAQGVFIAEALPEDKKKWIEKSEGPSLMVGDGVNDLVAMKAADLSLCMPGALEDNMNVSDVTLVRGDLESILNVFKLSQKIFMTERRLLLFTFTYNIICIGAAIAGYITPVAAAILMPISSIVVLSLVTLSLRRL